MANMQGGVVMEYLNMMAIEARATWERLQWQECLPQGILKSKWLLRVASIHSLICLALALAIWHRGALHYHPNASTLLYLIAFTIA
jgi:hypothetical protein